MKKLFGLAAAAALTLTIAAPVFATGNTKEECVKPNACTVPGVDLTGERLQRVGNGAIRTTAPHGKVFVCHYPGGEDALINGAGYNCVKRDGIIILVSMKSAAAHGLLP